MNIEKIDVKKINIITVVNDRFTKSTVEMLLEQQLFFANKINEIIDVLNEKKELKCTYCDFKTEEKNEKFLGEHMDIKHFHFKNDWENGKIQGLLPPRHPAPPGRGSPRQSLAGQARQHAARASRRIARSGHRHQPRGPRRRRMDAGPGGVIRP